MSNNRTLIRDACVITMDPALGTLDRADILIEGERIQAVEPNIGAEDCEVIDGTAMIAIPGLIDTHRHVWTAQLRGLLPDASNWDYIVWQFKMLPQYRPEDAYVGTYAGALEALESGVTTISDHVDCNNSPGYIDEVIRAHQEAGIRIVLLYDSGQKRFESPEEIDPMAFFETPEWYFEDARRVRENLLPSDDGLIRFGMSMHAYEGSPIEQGKVEIDFARELGAHLIGCNAGMGLLTGNVNYVLELANAGLLGPDMIIIHGNSLIDEELDRIAEAGAAIAAAPENELGGGFLYPMIGRAMERGAQTSLGVDTVMAFRGDLFTQMRFALQVERHRRHEELAKQGLVYRTNKITVQQMLELATIGGARALNLDAVVGSLTPGKQADVVLIRTDRLGLAPVGDPVGTVVTQANAGDVDSVFVAGEPVKRSGQLLNVDLPPLLDRVAASREYLVEESERYDIQAGIEMAEMALPLGEE
jgi:cytosine/adenosine deaminase-related metal-dependent hydrolase